VGQYSVAMVNAFGGAPERSLSRYSELHTTLSLRFALSFETHATLSLRVALRVAQENHVKVQRISQYIPPACL